MLNKFLYSFFGILINLEIVIVILLTLSVILLFIPIKDHRSKISKWGKRTLLTVLMLVFLLLSPLPFWSLATLENYYLPAPNGHGLSMTEMDRTIQDAEGFIMLGGSFDRAVMATRNNEFAFNQAAGRFIQSVEIIRRYPHKKVLFTGKGVEISGALSEAAIAKKLFNVFGIDSSSANFIWEDQSRNTLENAVFSYQLVKPKPHEKWILLTSAFHMPRSVNLFKKLGWNVIPYPVDFHTVNGSFKWTPSLMLGILAWRASMGEWFSLINNYWFGKADCILPASCPSITPLQ